MNLGTIRQIILVFLILHLSGAMSPVAAADRLSPFEREGKWGYREGTGRVVISPRFTSAAEFSSGGIAPVTDDQGWAYIDRRGKVIIRPFVFDNGPDYFVEGLSRFTVDGRFGFFDRRGRIVIRPGFDFAYPFQEGLSAVCSGCRLIPEGGHRLAEGGRWGYIDRKGRAAIPLRFEAARPFEGDAAEVKQSGRWVCIDKRGNVLGDCEKRGSPEMGPPPSGKMRD